MKLVTLATFPSEFQATLAKNALEGEGVHATLAGGQPLAGPQHFDPLGSGVSLVVAEKDLKLASDILNEAWEYGGLHGGHEWPEEEKTGDRTYRISMTTFLVMLAFIMISTFLSFLFKGR